MPVPILFDGADAIGTVGIDAATAPSHRGQGLFEALARSVYEDGGRRGMPVTLCYPNVNSLRGFVKAGGHTIGQLATYVYPVDDAWVAARFGVPPLVARAGRAVAFRSRRAGTARRVERAPSGLDALWRRAGVTHGIRRDGAWWRWRYDAHPDRPYRLYELRRSDDLVAAAATVVREDFKGRFVYLLELLAADRQAARAVVAAVVDDHPGVSGLATTGLKGTPIAVAATRAGLRALPVRYLPKSLHFGVADNTGQHPDVASRPWSVAWGDLDHL
jgi:hypothetical protein